MDGGKVAPELRCPKCGGRHVCGCKSCRKNRVNETESEKDFSILGDNDTISCGHCGFTKHADWWLDYEWEQYEKWKKKNNPDSDNPDVDKHSL